MIKYGSLLREKNESIFPILSSVCNCLLHIFHPLAQGFNNSHLTEALLQQDLINKNCININRKVVMPHDICKKYLLKIVDLSN